MTEELQVFEWFWGELSHEQRLITTAKTLTAALEIFGGYERLCGAGLFQDHIRTAKDISDFFARVSTYAKETNRRYPVSYCAAMTDDVQNLTRFGTMYGPGERLTTLVAQVRELRLQHERGNVVPCFGELAPISRGTTIRLMTALVERVDLPELWSEPYCAFVGLPHRIYQPPIIMKVVDAIEPNQLLPRLWAMRTAVQEVLPRDELLALVGQVAEWEPLGDHRIIVRFNPDQSLRRQVTLIRQRVDDWLKRAGINPRW